MRMQIRMVDQLAKTCKSLERKPGKGRGPLWVVQLIISIIISFFWRSWCHRVREKKLHANVAVPVAPVRVPSRRPLIPSVTPVTLVTNDKGDNEMILGAVHRSPGMCLTAEENPRKPQLRDRLMKGMYDQRLPQMGSLSSK